MSDFYINNTNVKPSDILGAIKKSNNQKSYLANITLLNINGYDTYQYLPNTIPDSYTMYNPYYGQINSVENYFSNFFELTYPIYVYRITNIKLDIGTLINSIKFTDNSDNEKTVKCSMFIYKMDENGNIITTDNIWTNCTKDNDQNYEPQLTDDTGNKYKNIYSTVGILSPSKNITLDIITTSELVNIDINYISCYGDSMYDKFS